MNIKFDIEPSFCQEYIPKDFIYLNGVQCSVDELIDVLEGLLRSDMIDPTVLVPKHIQPIIEHYDLGRRTIRGSWYGTENVDPFLEQVERLYFEWLRPLPGAR